MNLDELISNRALCKRRTAGPDRLSRAIMEGGDDGRTKTAGGLKKHLNDTYGIDLVDVRIRRLSYPPQVREAIFDRIRSERNKKVADYQSEGAKLATDIRTQSEFQERSLLAEAHANERRIKGEADAQADRIRNEAHAKDPSFYAFLKKLEEYQKILGDNKTLLLLSSQRELFDLLLKPPLRNRRAKPPAMPGSSSPAKRGSDNVPQAPTYCHGNSGRAGSYACYRCHTGAAGRTRAGAPIRQVRRSCGARSAYRLALSFRES